MKIKTREDALLHCFDLWLWLAVTGTLVKADWPGWMENGGHLEPCQAHCPACDYTKRGDWEDCTSSCPLKWTNGWCNDSDGEFCKWNHAQSKKDRKKWALEIAILALKAL